MMGVRNMMVVFEVCDSSSSGTEAERKRISSVTGPWLERLEVLFCCQIGEQRHTATKLRHPIQLPIDELSPRNRIQSRHRPSTTPASKSGPRNRVAVNPRFRIASVAPTGQYPMECKDLRGLPPSTEDNRIKVPIEQTIHDDVTKRMRPRMTEGASRESCGDGRVVGEK